VTATFERLKRLGGPHARGRVAAAVLQGVGVAAGIAALGLWWAPRPLAVAAAWLAILGVLFLAGRAALRAARTAQPRALAPVVERVARLRAGSIAGILQQEGSGSVALFALADERATGMLADADPVVRPVLWAATRRRVLRAAVALAVGAVAVVLVSPAPAGAAFWHPLTAFADARAPIRIDVDHDRVRRGDFVDVTIAAPGATTAMLWMRGPGEPWRATPVPLDAARGSRRLGPLDTDVFLRATSGSRSSPERHVAVALPAFLASLDLTARFPRYLERADEQLAPGPDTVPLPTGTVVTVSGTASVALARAAWVGAARDQVIPLTLSGAGFQGRLAPRTSGVWHLEVRTADGAPLEGEDPELALRIIADSAPVVLVPVPGHDASLPLSLRQPLVIDAHDDHAVTRVELVSWRVSQTGKVGELVRERLAIGPASAHVLLETELDATHRNLLPGDTLRMQVVAWDNAPVPQEGRSAALALLLPTLTELRAATRDAARDLGDTVSALAQAAAALADHTRDLAAQRQRAPEGGAAQASNGQPGALPFDASERAAAVAHDQAELEQRARQLAQAVDDLARAANAADMRDTAFAARLDEVRRLLQRALTPELSQRLRELQAAVARLDPQATREALDALATAEQQFRQALERSQDLFKRAAVEGALASLAADAEELRRRQGHWNETDGPHPDSAAAVHERGLAAGTDSLARGIAQAAQDLSAESPEGTPLAEPAAAAEGARTAMRGAAGAADLADASAALRQGQAAESDLARVPGLLRQRRDSLTHAWRQETLEALDRALDESVDLARREQAIVDSLRHGDAGPGLRARQASVEQGAAAVLDQVRAAEGRHALVSPQLEGVVGFAERQMGATRAELEEAAPNVDAAASDAEQSVDALNATAYALVRAHNDVAGAQSGTGFAEAIAQLARLAQQQGSLNAQAQGLLPLAIGPGGSLRYQLGALAQEQRALADQLERLQATGGSSAAGPLGQEARDLAAQLEAGRVDAQLVQRQDRLYHRLLDAGRTLSSPEPAQDRERVSVAASGDSVHVPVPLRPGAAGLGPLLRFPTWEELRDLTPDERRLVLEYFQRVNAPPSR